MKFLENKSMGVVIWVLSIVIPVVVAVLLFLPSGGRLSDLNVDFLPHLNGMINTATALTLILGFYGIKVKKNEQIHRFFMMISFVLGSLFLVSYVLYHASVAPTKFGGEGTERLLYFSLLISHIVLAAVVVPLVLFAVYFALSRQIDKHKKIVKFTFPIWLYVSVTGVLVYLMIKPYY